jgi:hypothetical protein
VQVGFVSTARRESMSVAGAMENDIDTCTGTGEHRWIAQVTLYFTRLMSFGTGQYAYVDAIDAQSLHKAPTDEPSPSCHQSGRLTQNASIRRRYVAKRGTPTAVRSR